MFEVALVRSKLRDRLGWSGPVGSVVKGDVIFYNDMIIVSTSSGAIVSMTKNGDTVWLSARGRTGFHARHFRRESVRGDQI
jgi:hypothetical protein